MRLILVCLLAGVILMAPTMAEVVDDEFGDELEEAEVEATDSHGAVSGQVDTVETDEFDEDEEFDDADDEEVEAPAKAPAAPAAANGEKAEASAAAAAMPTGPAKRNNLPETWELEVIALTGVALYIVAYFVGSRTNQAIATAWFDTFGKTGTIIPSSFAKTMLCADDGSPFSKDTANQYRFYASGRRNTLGLIVNLSMLPRQDLLSWVLAMLSGDEDTVTMEIFIEPSAMDPFVLAAVPRKIRRRVQKESGDLAAFASIVEPRKLPAGFDGLSVLTDATEACTSLLKGATARLIASHTPALTTNRFKGDSSPDADPVEALPVDGSTEVSESVAVERVSDPLFRMLHVTDNVPYYDRGVTPLSSHAVRFQFKLPSSSSRMEELQSLTKLAIDFADKVASFKLTREGSKKNTQARKVLHDAKRREQDQGSESSGLNKQREAMAAKDAELRKLQRTDPKEFKKQMKRLETKMMRKKTKIASK